MVWMLLNESLCARRTVRPNKLKCWSLEQRKVYCRPEQGEWVTPKLLKVFQQSIFFKLINFILFIYFWLCWVFVAEGRLLLVAANGGYSSLRCTGFSLRWLLLLQSMGPRRAGFSSCGSRALERSLSSGGAWS